MWVGPLFHSESHRIAQDRTATFVDRALQIVYWRNGHVELRPPLGRALFCAAGNQRRQHLDGVARPTERPHASSTDSVIVSISANMLSLTVEDYKSKPPLLAKTNPISHNAKDFVGTGVILYDPWTGKTHSMDSS
jgi:hypothetical protein